MTMQRLRVMCVPIALAGCNAMVPANLRMPEFGAQFEPAVHQRAIPDAASIIVYRDADIEDRIKYGISTFGVEPRRLTRIVGYAFGGGFLRIDRPAGTWRLIGTSVWWDENPPAGESFLGRMNTGHPPTGDGGITVGSGVAALGVSIEPGTITYMKLTRSVSSELVSCGQSQDAVSVCRQDFVETAFEVVPPDRARIELAGLRDTFHE